MLFFIWLVLCLATGSMLLIPLLLWRREIFNRYSGSRLVACPESQRAAVVSIDTRHAAATGIDGCPELRLCECTRWPERSACDQGCMAQAVRVGAYLSGKARVRTKQIYHLPILLAAFAAWYLGLIWHSQHLFRPGWLNATGLTREQVGQAVLWNSTHLLTAGFCLLFAYGVAWLLALRHRKGVLQGVLMSVLLCGALVAASLYGIVKLPHQLLALEAGYVVLATLAVGAIVGGLYSKLVLPARSSAGHAS